MLLVAFLIYRHKMKMKVKKAEIDSRMNDILRLTKSIEKEKRKRTTKSLRSPNPSTKPSKGRSPRYENSAKS